MPARSISTATISLGMVSIPVKVYSTTEAAEEVHLHLLHDADGGRLKQQYACALCEEVVDREHTVRGYEHAKGQYVVLSQEELDALDAVATGAIEIREFVPLTTVDPLWVEKSYYLGPDKGSERGYRLLRDAMQVVYDGDPGVAIASYSARGKQYVVALRSRDSEGLVMYQLRYAQEVKPWSEVPVPDLPPVSDVELGLARRIIREIASERFDPGKYRDEVLDRKRELIARKVEGQEIRVVPESPSGRALGLMDALRASLGSSSTDSQVVPPAPAVTSPTVASPTAARGGAPVEVRKGGKERARPAGRAKK